jgi:hypothetical protein
MGARDGAARAGIAGGFAHAVNRHQLELRPAISGNRRFARLFSHPMALRC